MATLCTIEELREYLNDKETSDTILELYINAVSDFIYGLIGKDIMAKDYIEKYKGSNKTTLVLKHYPVNEIKEIAYVNPSGEREISESEYDVNSKSGIIYKDSVWCQEGLSNTMYPTIKFPARHIRVSYNAGYKEVPWDLKLLAMEMISEKMAINNSAATKQGLKSYSISDVKKEWKTEFRLNSSYIATINKYRSMNI